RDSGPPSRNTLNCTTAQPLRWPYIGFTGHVSRIRPVMQIPCTSEPPVSLCHPRASPSFSQTRVLPLPKPSPPSPVLFPLSMLIVMQQCSCPYAAPPLV